jgi:hypothetical protein
LTAVNDKCRPASLRWDIESTDGTAIGRQSGKRKSFAREIF